MSPSHVVEVYKYYCETFGKSPTQYKLVPARHAKIETRLKEFTVEELKTAIYQLSKLKFNLYFEYVDLDKQILRSRQRVQELLELTPEVIKRRNKGFKQKYGRLNIPSAPPQKTDNPKLRNPETEPIDNPKDAMEHQLEQLLAGITEAEKERELRRIEAEIRRKYPVARTWTPEVLRETAFAQYGEKFSNKLTAENAEGHREE